MATVSRRRRKVGVDDKGKTVYRDEGWQVRYVDPDGREHTKAGFKTKKGPGGADSFANDVETRKARGTYVDGAAGKETFKEYSERWRLAQAHKPQTVNAVERRLRVHVYPIIGDKAIASIRYTDLTGLDKTLKGKLKPSYRRKVVADVKAVFSGAVLDHVLAVSPAEKLALPRLPKRKPEDVVLFEDAQLDAIGDALDGRWNLTADLGVGAGLRIGEVLGLEVGHVDFLRREIRVVQQMQTIQGTGVVIVEPKTDESTRVIPVSDELLARIAAHVARYCPDGGLLFMLHSGRPVSSAMWSQVWTAAVAEAKLKTGTRFHWLRHTYASALIHGGCSVKEVQARLGHATAKETLDTYGHLWPSSEDRTRDASAAVFLRGSDQDRTSADRSGR